MNVEDFLALMGRVGGYNRMKQLGVASAIAGQILVGMLGGVAYAIAAARLSSAGRRWLRIGLFIALPTIAVSAVLWPVLGTHQFGLPIPSAEHRDHCWPARRVRRIRAHARALRAWNDGTPTRDSRHS
jgi:hypothetical protein